MANTVGMTISRRALLKSAGALGLATAVPLRTARAQTAPDTQGRRIVANGGSDLHGVENTTGFAAGTPTTVVFAEALSTRAVTDGLRAGRCFVTRRPDGVELYLRVRGPRDQDQAIGGTVFGGPTDVVEAEVTVRRAAGMRLILWANGGPLSVTPISADEEVVTASLPIGPGGYIRAEARSAPVFEPDQPLGSRLDIECFTNAVYLVNGPEPDGNAPFVAPPPSATADAGSGGDDGSVGDGVGDGGSGDDESGDGGAAPASPTPTSALPATGAGAGTGLLIAAAGAGVVAARRRPVAPPQGVGHAAANSATTAPRGQPHPFAGRVIEGAVPMTLTEVVHRAGTGDELTGVVVRLVGQVTAIEPGAHATVTRWTPSCCDDVAVDVQVDGLVTVVGEWWELRLRWVPPTGAGFRSAPVLTVAGPAVRLATPPPRREA